MKKTSENTSATSKTYTITLTKDQLEVLSQATEVFSRLGIGQFYFALNWLPFKPKCCLEHETTQLISRELSPYLIHDIDGLNSSLGINNGETSESAKIAWDLHQSIRHRLSWERAVEKGIVASLNDSRKWPEMMGVNYDDPMITSHEPLPKINNG